MTDDVKNFRDDELIAEFQKLVIELGKDITKNHVLEIIKDEFLKIKQEQDNILIKMQDNIKKFDDNIKNFEDYIIKIDGDIKNFDNDIKIINNDVKKFNDVINKNLRSLLEDTSAELSKHNTTITNLRKINDEFIHKIKLYFEDKNVVKMTEELIKYTEDFTNAINYSQQILKEAVGYQEKLISTFSSLNEKIPDFNERLNNIHNEMHYFNKKIENALAQQKDEIKNVFESILANIGKTYTEVRDDINKEINSLKKGQENIIENQHYLKQYMQSLKVYSKNNFEDLLSSLDRFRDESKDNDQKIEKLLKEIKESGEKTKHETNNKFDKNRKLVLGALTIGIINFFLLISVISKLY